jgi:hypothetical protein
MPVKKYKISHANLPPNIFKEEGGASFLHLKVRTLRGTFVELKIKDGDVVKTSDPIAQAALEAYTAPHIPIKHKPKDRNEKVHAHYDASKYKNKKGFSSVAANSSFDHVVE